MIAFSTVLSDNYVDIFTVMIKSILKHNPDFKYDFYVFCDDRLSNDNMFNLSKYYKFRFDRIDTEKYSKFNKGHIKFYSCESFNLKGYEKVIFLDGDMLCINKIDELVKLENTLGMVRERRRPTSFNAGCIVIGKEHLTGETYNKLLNADFSQQQTYGVDQKLYNLYFSGNIEEIDIKYNTLITEYGYCDLKDIVFLHYIHKPNLEIGKTRIVPELLKIWNDYAKN